jgi:cyanophycin synthetase
MKILKSVVLIAGRMFDHIIIRQEKYYLRGRTEQEIIDLIFLEELSD